MVRVAITFAFFLMISATAWAANWNQSKKTETPYLPDSITKSFSVNQKVITSIEDRDYHFCSPKHLDWTGRDIGDLERFTRKYSDYFSPDYVSTFTNTDTGKLIKDKEVYSSFEKGLIDYTFALQGQHHNCLFKQNNGSCKKLIDIASALTKKRAATNPRAPIKDTDIPFTTIQKMLLPTIIGYSSAVQVLGKPENHSEIGKWFEDAFEANVFNTKTGEGIDLFRREKDFRPDRKKFGCYKSAQNHSLQSGFLYMAHSVIWGDLEKLNIGLDQLKITLQSVKSDGALPCEVTRGPNSLFYSGATIHTMLQMLHLMSLQQIEYSEFLDLKQLHKTISFQIDAGLNPAVMEKYTKSFTENVWCKPYKSISGQCIYQRPKRNVSFGWIQLYIKLFPSHKNTARLNKLFQNFQEKEIESYFEKLNLNAIFQPNQTKSTLKLNYEDIGNSGDVYMSHFNDTSDWARGSPLCLFGLSKQFSKKGDRDLSSIPKLQQDDTFSENVLATKSPYSIRTTKYDRTIAGMRVRFKCLADHATANDISDLPSEQEIESLITNLVDNDYYRSHRQIIKAGISKEAMDANKTALVRLVNYEGTNEEYCAKPVL